MAEKEDYISRLPRDVLMLIALDVGVESIQDLGSLRLTSRLLRDTADPIFWQMKLYNKYGFRTVIVNIELLKQIDNLLEEMYTKNAYRRIRNLAIEQNINVLSEYINNLTYWGIIDFNGIFRIGSRSRNGSFRRLPCIYMSKHDIINIILIQRPIYGIAYLNSLSKGELCDLLLQIFRESNKLFEEVLEHKPFYSSTKRPATRSVIRMNESDIKSRKF